MAFFQHGKSEKYRQISRIAIDGATKWPTDEPANFCEINQIIYADGTTCYFLQGQVWEIFFPVYVNELENAIFMSGLYQKSQKKTMYHFTSLKCLVFYPLPLSC